MRSRLPQWTTSGRQHYMNFMKMAHSHPATKDRLRDMVGLAHGFETFLLEVEKTETEV